MEKKLISEEQIKTILDKILSEQTSKVSRKEYYMVEMKIQELELSLKDTLKELKQLEDSIPDGLKTVTKGRMSKINNYLYNGQFFIKQMKEKIAQYRRSSQTINK